MKFYSILRVLVVVVLFLKAHSAEPTKIKNTLSKVETYEKVGNFTDNEFMLLYRKLFGEYGSYRSGLTCRSCRVLFGIARKIWPEKGISHFVAVQFAINICTALGIQHREVCKGVIHEFHHELYYLVRNVHIRSDAICGALLGKDCGGGISVGKPWTVPLLDTPKPPISEIKPLKPVSVVKVLHLTDLHIDLQYKENTSSTCGEPLCCRENNGAGNAGYWGSFGCDLPMRTFESALKHIRETHKDLSYIILTGDIPPHDIWQDTKKSQINIMKRVLQTISKYFPDKKVFLAAGNHDTHPANSFPQPSVRGEYSIQWLYDAYADMWSVWLPNSSLSTIRKGGYYTVLLSEGFRIVSINNNYCSKMNWWLLLNNTDPAEELQWLIQVLQAAEDKGEKVHIIAHFPTGSHLCYKYWSWNYHKIINRYESTVTAQFCGHTHQDHFEIFYDLADKNRPFSLWYIAPSLTTSSKYQPSYRIYEVDGNHVNSSRVVLDHKTFVLNLEKSNKLHKAFWESEYSAKEAYNMKSLLPKDWEELVKRMETDDKLFQMYYKFKYRYPLKERCDQACKNQEICAMRTARSSDTTFCRTNAEPVSF